MESDRKRICMYVCSCTTVWDVAVWELWHRRHALRRSRYLRLRYIASKGRVITDELETVWKEADGPIQDTILVFLWKN